MKTATSTTSRHAAPVAALVLLLALAGCGGDESAQGTPSAAASSAQPPSAQPSTGASAGGSGPSPTPEPEPEPEGTVIEVTVDGDTVEPRAERLRVGVGEPITFRIDADRAGEMHVHSTPEVDVPFRAGRSVAEVTLDQPGIVEVELHEPTEATLLQLEVR